MRYQAACAVLFKNSTFVALTPGSVPGTNLFSLQFYAGKMLFLPPGTIYSAFSCVDSISFAGLFFSSYQCRCVLQLIYYKCLCIAVYTSIGEIWNYLLTQLVVAMILE